MSDLSRLPSGLPEPVDDGAADHLLGASLPATELASTSGSPVDLRSVEVDWLVIYVYPRTGGPDVDLPDDWSLLPGAKGCTPQGCSFRDHQDELAALGATVYGLSAQPPDEQQRFAERMAIPFPLLNDSGLTLSEPPLRLPTLTAGGLTLYRRVTLVSRAGRIEHVRYPVFPPDRDATDVIAWLERAV